MEDILASMWNNMRLTENETTTLHIDPTKLSIPNNALVGRLIMHKHVSPFELEKGLRSICDATNTMEATLIGDNMFLFVFANSQTCDHILEKQPWNFHGSLILLDRMRGDECPTYFLQYAPAWIQAHGLQIRAMNKSVGEDVGVLLGKILEVRCDAGRVALGRCIRIHA